MSTVSDPGGLGPRRHTFARLARRLLRSTPGTFGLFVIVSMIFMAVLAPWLAPHDPARSSIHDRLVPPAFVAGGTPRNLLGTDAIGRDVASRILYGSRISLAVGVAAVVLGALVGVTLGLVAGYFGGFTDSLLAWVMNVQLSFPYILLAIFVIAAFGGGLIVLIVVLAMGGWVRYARIMRGQVFAVREKEYIEGARALGASTPRLLLRHVLPNAVAPMIVVASFTMSETILAEAALSFLGLGVDPRIPTWGGMLSDGRAYLQDAWWIATFPGIMIVLTVLGINLFGDWVRDLLDPSLDV